jgi:hypothetical protein
MVTEVTQNQSPARQTPAKTRRLHAESPAIGRRFSGAPGNAPLGEAALSALRSNVLGRKLLFLMESFVSGHGFSRAAHSPRKTRL